MTGAVGFDLDMTLVDSRPGIHAALTAFAAETGRPIDADAIVSRLGPPVAEALSPWFAPHELPEAVESFRGHMARVGVMNVLPLPGAAAAVAAVREHGLAVVVVTAKIRRLAASTLEHAGLIADEIYGNVWSAEKAQPLREVGATAYVGDHPGDMAAAIAAGVAGIGVTSGSSTAAELSAAGASVVLDSLADFPRWLSVNRAAAS